jgi:acetyl-CoA acetyltransferase
MAFKARRVAFVGTGTSPYARSLPNRTQDGLLAEAVVNAIANAGLKKEDIDGLILTFSSDPYIIAESLGMYALTLCMNNENGAGSSGFAGDLARWALETGRCKHVVLVCGQRDSATGRIGVGSNFSGRFMEGEVLPQMHWSDLDTVWGGTWLHQYAAQAQRHMYEFGTTVEQLAAIAVSNRYNASLNPDAVYQDRIVVDDVLNAKMISTPLTMLMCAMVNDGASAAVITTAERAVDLPNRPVYVIGTGSAFTGYTFSRMAADPGDRFNMLRTVGSVAAEDAFRSAGVDRSDIDFIQSSEHFVPSQLLLLEDYGFCGRGEGGAFIGDGSRTMVGGELPFNTYGGESSGTHASSSHAALVEAIRQLQGDCGNRQVKDAKVGLFAATSGKISTHSLLVLAAG